MTRLDRRTVIKRSDTNYKVESKICQLLSSCFKDGLTLKNQIVTNSSVLHSHTVLMKLCPCGRYRQLKSVLYPINHIPTSSKIIFNGLVLKEF